MDDQVRGGHGPGSLEGDAAGDQLVEEESRAEDVAAGVEGLAGGLLRREVRGGAEDRVVARLLRDAAEIEQLDPRAAAVEPLEKDVLRLEVAVRDTGSVRGVPAPRAQAGGPRTACSRRRAARARGGRRGGSHRRGAP